MMMILSVKYSGMRGGAFMTSRDTTRTHGSLFGSGILRGPNGAAAINKGRYKLD